MTEIGFFLSSQAGFLDFWRKELRPALAELTDPTGVAAR